MSNTIQNWHPAAEAYPMLDGVDYERLKDSVARHGVLKPIEVYTGTAWPEYAGLGIDGRNRARAAAECGRECPVRNLSDADIGGSITDYITTVNSVRRHEDTGMRAAIAVGLESCYAEEAKQRMRDNGGDRKSTEAVRQRLEIPAKSSEEKIPHSIRASQSRERAAAVCDVNDRYVQDAKRLSLEAPALFQKLKVGAIKLPAAMAALKRKEENPDAWAMLLVGAMTLEQFNASCELNQRSPELWRSVSRGKMQFADAMKEMRRQQKPKQPESAATKQETPARQEPTLAVSSVPADCLGRPLPESLIQVFKDAQALADIAETLIGVTQKFHDLQLTQSRRHFKCGTEGMLKWVNGFLAVIDWGRPKCVCPSCHGVELPGKDSCPTCHGEGWVSNNSYKSLSAELRAVAESHASGGKDICGKQGIER